MPDRPILFSAPMVRALLDGRKTQTRRVLKPQPFPVGGPFYRPFPNTDARQWYSISAAGMVINIQTVPYAPGDRLWVKEAWRCKDICDDVAPREMVRTIPIRYEADGALTNPKAFYWVAETQTRGPVTYGRTRSPLFMPRWASRLTLDVTEVRVQRLQEISEADARAEGIEIHGPDVTVYRDNADRLPEARRRFDAFCINQYRTLWNSIHGPEAWDANPWVCALTFTVRKGNIDDA